MIGEPLFGGRSIDQLPQRQRSGMGHGARCCDEARAANDARQGERLRLRIVNDTMMFHPVHLHGHTFQVVGSSRKDTVNVPSMGAVEVDIEADNPGQWMLHCHNTYHFESGMATVLSYRR